MNSRQRKKNIKMNTMILPNGDLVRRECILALRKRGCLPEYKKGPALLIDLTNNNTIILEFNTESQRDGFLGEAKWLLGW
jgi:hypothetical protein